MNTTMLTRVAGVLLILVFLVNLYLGLYDTNLKMYNMVHWDLNWLIAVASLVGAILLLVRPLSRPLIILAGVIWPIVYVLSLGVDVYTKLCAGAPTTSCWPSHTAAFDYLVLNESNIPGATGYGWMLAPVMPIAILLLAIVFILSLISLSSMSKRTKVTPAVGPTTPKSTVPEKPSDTKGT